MDVGINVPERGSRTGGEGELWMFIYLPDMVAYEMISNVVPVLKRTDSCLQALNWMEVFRVSHLPLTDGSRYLGLVSDELVYGHGDLNDGVEVLSIPVDGTYVYEDYHIYDVIRLVSSGMLSVVPVLSRADGFVGSIVAADILYRLDKLLCVDEPGGIIVLEINRRDYSLAEVARIVEGNDARILSSCVNNGKQGTSCVQLTIKVNVADVSVLLDAFIRHGYTVKDSFVAGEEQQDSMKERYGLLMKYLAV